MPRLFVDNITVIDCSILDPERGLIGASWVVDVELQGDLDEQSMVFDFAKVKKTIKQLIDQQVDHKLLLPATFSGIDVSGTETCTVNFSDHRQELIRHQSPASAITLVPTSRVSRKSVIAYLTDLLMAVLPDNVQTLHITLTEEQTPGNYYCYSHGLKKHDGNCQRIAHGHRSQIQIWKDGVRNPHIEQTIARQWEDIYLGTEEDVSHQDDERIQFKYHTEQGSFMLELPKPRVYLMQNDSTIECIAAHLQKRLSQEHGDALIKVKAFEGIGKGAIA